MSSLGSNSRVAPGLGYTDQPSKAISTGTAMLNSRSHSICFCGQSRDSIRYTGDRFHDSSPPIYGATVKTGSDAGNGAGRPEGASVWRSSGKQKLILACIILSYMSSFMCLSILAPFFPAEAASRDVSDSISGWVFGVFALVQFLTSPIMGRLLPVMGAKYLFLAGQFFAGGCTVLFGLVSLFPRGEGSRLTFISLCFTLRILLALGCTANNTACFAIVTQTFPGSAVSVVGFIEAGSGVGLAIGPSLGGVLFDAGGFVLPFAVIGSSMLVGVIPLMYIVPKDQDTTGSDRAVSACSLLRQPGVVVVSLSVVSGAILWISLDPTLEPHLRQYNLSGSMVGLVFLLVGGMYSLLGPVWGYITDRFGHSLEMMVLGYVLSAVAMLLLGPFPLFMEPSSQPLWLNIVALALLGVSVGLAIIPSFDRMFESARRAGLSASPALYGMIAGLWYSVYALGETVGPIAAGWLLDNVGFGWCMTGMAGLSLVTAVLLFTLFIAERCCCPRGAGTRNSVASSSDLGGSLTGSPDDSCDETAALLSRGSDSPPPLQRRQSWPSRLRTTVKSPVAAALHGMCYAHKVKVKSDDRAACCEDCSENVAAAMEKAHVPAAVLVCTM